MRRVRGIHLHPGRERAGEGPPRPPSPRAEAPEGLAALGNRTLTRLRELGATARPELGPPDVSLRSQLRSLNAPPVQALTTVGAADDRLEREAHAVADATGPAGRIAAIDNPAEAGLRAVPPAIRAGIDRARGGGRPLPGDLAATIGRRLDTDLHGVRVHTDEGAHALNEALSARAFTTGRDIFFRRGEYDPVGAAGRRVLTHELTHVAQQRGLAGAHAPIQRFIMQVGAEDGYTTTMSDKLKADHGGEGFLQFKAKWDSSWGFWDFGTYAPKSWHKPKADERLPSYGPSKKLKGVGDAEPLRIVGHGNIAGKLGGYSGAEMGSLILSLGLPNSHTGGVDVHGCLPASNWWDEASKEYKPAHTVALEDFLAKEGVQDVVRGYEHCIYPDIGHEVASSVYSFFEIARAVRNVPKATARKLTAAEKDTIDDTMGADAAAFYKSTLADDEATVVDHFYFYWCIQEWLKKQGKMQKATLIDTAKARRELDEQ